MERPSSDIAGCRAAHELMASVLSGLTDAVVPRPTLLPGWSVGHVVTHLARNAESTHRRIAGAARGEVVAQYEGGAAGRAAEIEAGAGRSAEQLVADAVHWSNRLDDVFATLPDEVWERPVRMVAGGEHAAAELPFRRWREVEVHLADLGIGFTPADWSQGLVDRAMPALVAGLADRADACDLMAWLLGRGDPPQLSPWG